MSFHVFHINELYSNADGTVQFIEFVGDGNGQDRWATETMTSTGAADYTFASDLPSSSTLGKSVLVATQGFADLGLVTPDYIIPDGFLSVSGGTLTFIGMDSITFGALPGGIQSINGSGVTGTNSPTNFDGDSGSIPGNPIVGTATSNTLSGTSGRDFMVGIGGNDTLNGRGGSDTVNGGTGNDILTGGTGNDVLLGGTGKDTASYQSDTASGITLNLGLTGAQATGGAGTDTLSGIERATGSGFADRLTGSNSANVLKGLGGGDTLMGRGGDDTLNGGGGADKFLFDSALNVGTNVDVIADFAPGIDRIHLDEDIFTALAAGALPPGRFHSVPGATDANDATDRIIYDSANGNLYYDADGNGELSSSVLFATLTTHPAITAADFFIVN
jgi:Ca2+-binding RTX toxin-like protein